MTVVHIERVPGTWIRLRSPCTSIPAGGGTGTHEVLVRARRLQTTYLMIRLAFDVLATAQTDVVPGTCDIA